MSTPANRTKTRDSQSEELASLYELDTAAAQPFRDTLDRKEALMVGENTSLIQGQGGTSSGVKVNSLSTMIYDSNARVVAQLPSGVVNASSRADKGCSLLMGLTLDKYIVPNAGEQFDLLTTWRLLNQKSKEYGVQPLFLKWKVPGPWDSSSYVGPTFKLPPIRSFTPQRGVVSMRMMQYAFLDSYVPVAFLRDKVSSKSWKGDALKRILAKAEEAGHDRNLDTNKTTFVERNRDLLKHSGGRGDYAMVWLVTKYEAGRDGHWVTFCPDFDYEVIRDISNPHKNRKIPIILKHCFPSLDSIWGIGDVERGESLDLAINTVFNMFLDGIKLSLFPPKKILTGKVVMSSLKSQPGANWLMSQLDAVMPYQTGSDAVNNFQVAWDVLRASLLNLMGTNDTTTTASTDPGFGKTPEALKQLAIRESTRDNWDRFLLEHAIEEAYNDAIDLMYRNMDKPIVLDLFREEVAQLREAYPDDKALQALGMHDSGKYGSMTVTKKHLTVDTANDDLLPYRFTIDASSTMKKSQQEENDAAMTLFALLSKAAPQETQAAAQKVDMGQLVKTIVFSGGLSDADKIYKDSPSVSGTNQTQVVDHKGVPMMPGVNMPGPEVGKPAPLLRPENALLDPSPTAPPNGGLP